MKHDRALERYRMHLRRIIPERNRLLISMRTQNSPHCLHYAILVCNPQHQIFSNVFEHICNSCIRIPSLPDLVVHLFLDPTPPLHSTKQWSILHSQLYKEGDSIYEHLLISLKAYHVKIHHHVISMHGLQQRRRGCHWFLCRVWGGGKSKDVMENNEQKNFSVGCNPIAIRS